VAVGGSFPAVSNWATTINFVSYYFRVAFFYLYIGIGIILLLRRTSFSKRQNFSVQQFSTNSHATSFWNKSHRECAIGDTMSPSVGIVAKNDRSNLFLALLAPSTTTLIGNTNTTKIISPWRSFRRRYIQRLLAITRYPNGQSTPNLRRG